MFDNSINVPAETLVFTIIHVQNGSLHPENVEHTGTPFVATVRCQHFVNNDIANTAMNLLSSLTRRARLLYIQETYLINCISAASGHTKK